MAVLPIAVLIIFVGVLLRLVKEYNKDKQLHLLRSRTFWVNSILPMTLISVGGMILLECGGLKVIIEWYSLFHDKIQNLRLAMPITMGLLTTFIGLVVTFRLIHPRVMLYPLAAYEKINGKWWLSFLLKNNGWWECIDLKAELFECEFEKCGNDYNKKMEPIALDTLATASVIGWTFGHSNENTYLIETKYNVFHKKHFLQSDAILELRVRLTHPLSRITNVFIQHYKATDIHYGVFEGHGLVRFANGDQTARRKNLIMKDVFWRAANILKILEGVVFVFLLFVVCYCMTMANSHNPECLNMTVTSIFYWGMLLEAVLELIRQTLICPFDSKPNESNIK